MALKYTFFLAVALGMAVCYELDADEKKCVEETGVDQEKVIGYITNQDEATEELLCFVKCTFEKKSLLAEDGTLLIDDVKDLDAFEEDFSKDQQEAVFKCLKGMQKVKTCNDMLPLTKCFDDAV